MKYDEPKGFWGCFWGILELVGFFVAITWPILMLIFNHKP